MELSKTYVLLLAGGKGTRFWPLSREEHPKQLLKLFSSKTLVEETYERIHPVIPNERVIIATSRILAPKIMQLFPFIPKSNFIIEPVPRSTAACIGYASMLIEERDPDGIIVALPSDHYVADNQSFLDHLESASIYAHTNNIVTLGITPTHPETGFGYIKFGELVTLDDPELSKIVKHRARKIDAFVEKPDRQTAISYLSAGRYLWNSGIFVFRAKTMLDEIEIHLPGLYEGLQDLKKLLGKPDDRGLQERLWEQLPNISIDYGVMEKSKRVLVIPSSFGWSDVGSWRALTNFPTDENGNFKSGNVIALNSKRNVLYSNNGLLAVLGLEEMAVVVTKEAVLVVPLERSEEVRNIVEELKNNGLDHYL